MRAWARVHPTDLGTVRGRQGTRFAAGETLGQARVRAEVEETQEAQGTQRAHLEVAEWASRDLPEGQSSRAEEDAASASWSAWEVRPSRASCAACARVKGLVLEVRTRCARVDRLAEAEALDRARAHPVAHFVQALAALLPPKAAQGAQAHQGDQERRRERGEGEGRQAEQPVQVEGHPETA